MHDLGFSYDAKKNIAQNGKKGASKHLGAKQSIRLADPQTCEQVVNGALELMRREKLYNVKDFLCAVDRFWRQLRFADALWLFF